MCTSLAPNHGLGLGTRLCVRMRTRLVNGVYHGGLPVMVGWVASLVVIADSTTTTEHPHQSFHARLFCFVYVQFFFFVFFFVY